LDFLCIKDGTVVVVEVKTDAGEFNQTENDKLVVAAKKPGPSVNQYNLSLRSQALREPLQSA